MLTPCERRALQQAMKLPSTWHPGAAQVEPPTPEPFPVKSALDALSEALLALKLLVGLAQSGHATRDFPTVSYVGKTTKRLDRELQRLRGVTS